MKSIWKYHALLPAAQEKDRILLGEGQTPLIKSKSIGPELGLDNLYFKLENLNPTGSYKDRFAAMFVSLLQSRGIKLCLATSSGNTGAALAAYCAAANIKCVLAIVDGAPLAKVRQMQVYGAATYTVEGFGRDARITNEVFSFLEQTAASFGIPLPISAYHYCSDGMSGVQTIAYELLEETGYTVDRVFSPAGGGGLTLAVAKGIRVLGAAANLSTLPKVHCVQPEGNDTIASALRNKGTKATAVPYSRTKVSGLQVPSVLDGDQVIEECLRLQGTGQVVTDEQVFRFHQKLALQEGIFCEPAGAVALAGLAEAVRNKEVKKEEKAVCLVTGSGFKDMASVDNHFHLPEPHKLQNIGSLQQVLTTLI